MIRNAFTGEAWTPAQPPVQQETDRIAERIPASGDEGLKQRAAANPAAKALLREPTADASTHARVAGPAR